ncbi:MAG: hypothetical protein HY748_09225 [Elusimicrobia bacterium]|nr:hypothetical protein [Elusimicrobiota bacterium]
MNARDFGLSDDPQTCAEEDVRPYLGLSAAQRYGKFLDLMLFMERIWKSLDPVRRARYDRSQAEFDDPGRWWERVPRR